MAVQLTVFCKKYMPTTRLNNYSIIAKVLTTCLLALIMGQCKLMHPVSQPARSSTAKAPPASSKGTASTDQRNKIVAYAKKYIGTKYLYAGKSPKTGFDCSGFTSYVMAEYNVSLSPASREQVKQGKQKSLDKAQPGDLVFFRRGSKEPIFHVAMVVSNTGNSLKVIHSTTSNGVREDDILNSPYWKPYIDSVRDVL